MARAPKTPKFNKDGSPSQRGHGEGSRATRYAEGDGRPRPGKRKGARDDRTAVLAIRDMPVRVATKWGADGTPIDWRFITTREAMYRKWREKALKGDLRAGDMLDGKFTQFEPPPVDPDVTKKLLEEDQAILKHIQSRREIPPPLGDPAQPETPPAGDKANDTNNGDGA